LHCADGDAVFDDGLGFGEEAYAGVKEGDVVAGAVPVSAGGFVVGAVGYPFKICRAGEGFSALAGGESWFSGDGYVVDPPLFVGGEEGFFGGELFRGQWCWAGNSGDRYTGLYVCVAAVVAALGVGGFGDGFGGDGDGGGVVRGFAFLVVMAGRFGFGFVFVTAEAIPPVTANSTLSTPTISVVRVVGVWCGVVAMGAPWWLRRGSGVGNLSWRGRVKVFLCRLSGGFLLVLRLVG
jgi:hypothetical protein